MTSPNIRVARESDLERLTEIYNYYVIHTPITFDLEPFSVAERCEWFRHYSASGPHRLLIAETDGLVVGYVTSSRFRPKAACETSVETSIYLAPQATGRGIPDRTSEGGADPAPPQEPWAHRLHLVMREGCETKVRARPQKMWSAAGASTWRTGLATVGLIALVVTVSCSIENWRPHMRFLLDFWE